MRTTSLDAAESIRPHAETQRQQVLRALREVGAMTDEQLCTRLGMSPSSLRPRRGELVELGLVRDSGLTRPTKSGRRAVVWAALKVVDPRQQEPETTEESADFGAESAESIHPPEPKLVKCRCGGWRWAWMPEERHSLLLRDGAVRNCVGEVVSL